MPVIEVEHLHKRYGGIVAVEDVSFTVEQGEIFGILGRNGAGKTTTVECIAGLRRSDGGSVRVLGLDPRRQRPELTQRLGVQLQQSQLPDRIKVWEALDLYASFYRRPAAWRSLLDSLDLSHKRGATFQSLSGGQRQRLSIALALAGSPDVAILDELTTGLDPTARRDVWRLIRRIRDGGVTILVVTHLMEEAEHLCDRVAVIDAGRVVALETPARIVAAARVEQRIRFRPTTSLADGLLAGLPEVTAVEREGAQVVVTGRGDLLTAVAGVLARNRIVAADLRVEPATLDDAFLSLTDR